MNDRCLTFLIESGGVLGWFSSLSWFLPLKREVIDTSGGGGDTPPPPFCPPSFLPLPEPSASLSIVEYFTKQGN